MSCADESTQGFGSTTAFVLVPPHDPRDDDHLATAAAASADVDSAVQAGRFDSDDADMDASGAAAWVLNMDAAPAAAAESTALITPLPPPPSAPTLGLGGGLGGRGSAFAGGSTGSLLGSRYMSTPTPARPRGVVGLSNLGNTCYMNSSLQVSAGCGCGASL